MLKSNKVILLAISLLIPAVFVLTIKVSTPNHGQNINPELAKMQQELIKLRAKVDLNQQGITDFSNRLERNVIAIEETSQPPVKQEFVSRTEEPQAAIPSQKDQEQSREETNLMAEQAINEDFTGMENRLITEDYDPDWIEHARLEISSRLETEEFSELTLSELDCRSTVCKLSLEIDSTNTDVGSVIRKMSHVAPWPSETLMKLSSDAKSATMYVARDGYGLSSAEEQ